MVSALEWIVGGIKMIQMAMMTMMTLMKVKIVKAPIADNAIPHFMVPY